MASSSLLRSLALAVACTGLVACTPKVHRVAVDPSRLVVPMEARLACEHQLHEVVDARPTSERSGGLGVHMFVFDDVPGAVRRQFEQAGMAAQGGRVVDVRVLQFYLSQNTITKVPVAVYEVRVDGGAPFRVRSQLPSMNNWGSENEAYGAYASALADATEQVVARLNAGCPKAG